MAELRLAGDVHQLGTGFGLEQLADVGTVAGRLRIADRLQLADEFAWLLTSRFEFACC